MYSFSTCWNSSRHTDGRLMLLEIRELGFEYAELSHGIRISLLPGIFQAVDAGEIRISSLHNFCPLPVGVNHAAPNLYQFSSPDRRERESALKYSFKTLETAERVGASLVVLHMGSIEMKDYTQKLVALLEKNQVADPKFEKLCAEALQKQEDKKGKYLLFATECLHRLAEEAQRRGIRLGIENRESLEEIPLDRDLESFLRPFPENVGYWHDTGHGQIKQTLGFINQARQVEQLSPRLFGFHVHDVEFPCRDHRPPGSGSVDFSALKPFVRPEHIKVFELSPGLDREEVMAGVNHAWTIWGRE